MNEVEKREVRIPIWGGPKDGDESVYLVPEGQQFKPTGEITFVDPAVDPAKYRPGDLEHLYRLRVLEGGGYAYSYVGPFRRSG